jgi:hypothetical protein
MVNPRTSLIIYPLLAFMLICPQPLLATPFSSQSKGKQIVVIPPPPKDLDSFYDPAFDYTKFYGRVTDRDATSTVFKIKSENGNIKFLRAGDRLQFRVNGVNRGICDASVRDVEGNQYLTIYVRNLHTCWKGDGYFRRGSQLNFVGEIMGQRVREASHFRKILLQRKEDFYHQLNEINNFLASYNLRKVQAAAKYDQEILRIKKEKERALKLMLTKREDYYVLQQELKKQTDKFDYDLEHYRVEPVELFADRWQLDHDLGLPVQIRPQ